MNKGINLLAEKAEEAVSPILKKLELLRLLAIGFLFIISSGSVILFLLIFLSPLPALQKQEKDDLTTLSQYHPNVAKLQLIDDRLTTTSVIIKKRNNFDVTLGVLHDMMPRDLSITSLSMKDKDIELTVSSSSLGSLQTFINKLIVSSDKKESFSKVSLSSFITDEKRKVFIVSLNLVIL